MKGFAEAITDCVAVVKERLRINDLALTARKHPAGCVAAVLK